MTVSALWQARIDELWATLDEDSDPDGFIASMDELCAERGDDDALALFERGGARDSVGRPEAAVPLYRAALALGLPSELQRRATIQMASSIRNLGDPEESLRLLTEERARVSDDLDDAVAVFLALALSSLGRDREALSITIGALASHLPRYGRSSANYARDLVDPDV